MGKLKLGKTLAEIAENADFTINFHHRLRQICNLTQNTIRIFNP